MREYQQTNSARSVVSERSSY